MSYRIGFLCRLLTVSAVLIVQGAPQDHPVRCRSRLDIPQTHCWNLDDGAVSKIGQLCEPPFDFWYEAVNPTLRYLVPQHGAALAIVGVNAVGYAGCATADLSKKQIDFQQLKKGTFLCAWTSEGRYAEFSIDDLFDDPDALGTLTLRITPTSAHP
jgi:hypothetical protein